ncbi:uncharacterized protein mgarpb isoform X2 [Stigmatopora argus]
MFCRRVFQRLGPMATKVFVPTFRKAPVRHMAMGVPGGSSNMTYIVLCGGSLTAAVVYGYRTIIGDSERYEDRLANMGSAAKVEASSTEIEATTAEPVPVEEPVLPVEVVAESLAEPTVDETTVEPHVENSTPEDVGALTEILAEEEAESAAVEEAPTVVAEAAPAPMTVEDTPAETSPKAATDLLTAVKILTGATELAAASVGESSLVRAVRHIEEDGKVLDAVLELSPPEVLEGTEDHAVKEPTDETVAVINEESLESAAVSNDEDVIIEDKVSAEEVIPEEAASPVSDEEEEVPPDEAASSVPTEEIAAEIEAEDQNPVPDQEQNITLVEVAPSAESGIAVEAQVEQELPAAELAAEEGAGAAVEETVVTLEEEGTTQPLEANTGTEEEVLSFAEPESNSLQDSVVEVSNPTADQPTDIMEENEGGESVSPEEEVTIQPLECEAGSDAGVLSVAEPESNSHQDSLEEVSNPADDQPTDIIEENEGGESVTPEEEATIPSLEAEHGSDAELLSVAEPESNCQQDSLEEVSNLAADQPTDIMEENEGPVAVVVVINQS